MEIQRSEGIFKEEFELDKASIQSLTHSSAGPTDLQPSQALGGPPKRIMPPSMRSTDTPGQPARNSGSFQVHTMPRCAYMSPDCLHLVTNLKGAGHQAVFATLNCVWTMFTTCSLHHDVIRNDDDHHSRHN